MRNIFTCEKKNNVLKIQIKTNFKKTINPLKNKIYTIVNERKTSTAFY